MIDLKRNLLNELRPPGVPSEEFLAVLARRFPSSVHDTDTNFVLYPGNAPHELRVDFNKDGGLSGIFALPVLSPEKLDEIRQDIYTEFIETTDFGVGRQVFFSFSPFVAGGGIAIGYRFSLFRRKHRRRRCCTPNILF